MKNQIVQTLRESINSLVRGDYFDAVDKILGVIIVLQREDKDASE